MDIRQVKGIGEKTEKLFNKLGVDTTEQLLEYYPRNYDEYKLPITVKELDNEVVAAFSCMIVTAPVIKRVKNLSILIINARDDGGSVITLKWYNMPFLRGKFKIGMHLVFRGKVSKNTYKGRGSNEGEVILEQPEYFFLGDYEKKMGEMTPIYRLTEGLSNKLVTKSVRQVLDNENSVHEFMPEYIINRFSLMNHDEAIRKIHFPMSFLEMNEARKRLAFNEFFLFILALRRFKEREEIIENKFIIKHSDKTEEFISKLPYELTQAQVKVVDEIKRDFESSKVMNRLIQGDVGSGKTIVALIALLDTVFEGYQGAMMAPTEVLASQHFEGIVKMFNEYGIDIGVELLVGSMTAKEKREAYERIANGESSIIIGTNAIIQEKVIYKDLALVITDEQHRFGVKQREKLSTKGEYPHIIVMSATPIPRTLAIILYGDLDISVIDVLPKGRLPIKNCVVGKEYHPKAYKFIDSEVNKGRQCYVICPMIEENEDMDVTDVINYTNTLRENLNPNVKIEYLHGKMKPQEKNEIMERFSENKIQVLVSTTVIEVGINVPNATVMMVENAERFGLASLHQLRGRVGRGEHQSYCIFVSGSNKQETMERLEILNQSNDGFEIASWDLKLRGPGDFFGVRQSGEMDFKIGDIYSDMITLKEASDAVDIVTKDESIIEDTNMIRLNDKLRNYMTYNFKINI